MPQDFKKYVDPSQDGRRKLLPEQYEEVKEHYKISQSQRKTAKHFGVSRRLVQFITCPEKLKALQDRQREQEHWKAYYNKEEHTKAIKKYRDKKKSLGLQFNPKAKHESISTA